MVKGWWEDGVMLVRGWDGDGKGMGQGQDVVMDRRGGDGRWSKKFPLLYYHLNIVNLIHLSTIFTN